MLINFLFPHTCLLCNSPTQRNIDLCLACEKELPYIEHGCIKCGIPLIDTHIKTCGNCFKKPPAFDETIAFFHYKAPITSLIAQLKFHQKLVVSEVLGKLFATHLKNKLNHQEWRTTFAATAVMEKIDYLIPVPLHRKRLRERGFNQSFELARYISKTLQIPVNLRSCHRSRYTQQQAKMPIKLRKKNVKNAFQTNESLKGKFVAIIDDVMTTGNTVNEFAKSLKRSGAENVIVLALARAGVDKT